MKIRIYKRLLDGVFFTRVQTEDWSERDRELMIKYGEPEINLGGTFCTGVGDSSDSSSSTVSITLDTVYARILSESPFTQKFDSRDLSGIDGAKDIACQWCSAVESRIATKVQELRSHGETFVTEEITEY